MVQLIIQIATLVNFSVMVIWFSSFFDLILFWNDPFSISRRWTFVSADTLLATWINILLYFDLLERIRTLYKACYERRQKLLLRLIRFKSWRISLCRFTHIFGIYSLFSHSLLIIWTINIVATAAATKTWAITTTAELGRVSI